MRIRSTKKEKQLRQYLEAGFADTTLSVRQREKFRSELKALDEAAAARAKPKAAPETAPEWDTEWHRLEIKEKACQKILNNSKAHLTTIRTAEKELERIVKRRRELRPDYESVAETPAASADAREPMPDLSKLSNISLREQFATEKFFRKYLGVDSNSELIAALESEIRRRKLPMYFSVEGTNSWLYVDEQGNPMELMTDRVFMGRISLPEDHPVWKSPRGVQALRLRQPKDEQRTEFTPTTAQSTYWNRGSKADIVVPPSTPVQPDRSLTFAYRLYDGTTFWSWGEVQPANVPLPRSTQILAAPNPPNYQKGSGVIPAELVFDEIHFSWGRR